MEVRVSVYRHVEGIGLYRVCFCQACALFVGIGYARAFPKENTDSAEKDHGQPPSQSAYFGTDAKQQFDTPIDQQNAGGSHHEHDAGQQPAGRSGVPKPIGVKLAE